MLGKMPCLFWKSLKYLSIRKIIIRFSGRCEDRGSLVWDIGWNSLFGHYYNGKSWFIELIIKKNTRWDNYFYGRRKIKQKGTFTNVGRVTRDLENRDFRNWNNNSIIINLNCRLEKITKNETRKRNTLCTF